MTRMSTPKARGEVAPSAILVSAIQLPWGRSQESEADHIGLILMARAGYDPHEAIAFWQRMEKMAGSGQPPEFLSDHPSHETRVKDIESWIPEAMKAQQDAQSKKS